MAITDWPAEDRPREKLLHSGASSLNDAELLAIFLRVGVKGSSAVDLARQLLDRFGSLRALLGASELDFCDAHGLGPAKYVQLQAVLEMARRNLRQQIDRHAALESPDETRDYLTLCLRDELHEVFAALFLDNRHRPISFDILARGTISRANVYPREVVKSTLRHNAAAVIFAHNHPSGVAEPSRADERITQQLIDALKTIDVRVLDHFVIGDGDIVSFAERGML